MLILFASVQAHLYADDWKILQALSPATKAVQIEPQLASIVALPSKLTAEYSIATLGQAATQQGVSQPAQVPAQCAT